MNYSKTGFNYITNTIWIDSARAIGSDSVFYLNRIVTYCDTCPATYRLCNQPDFLRKNMYKRSVGKYEFRYPGSFLIKTFANSGESWLYDTANSITATVFSVSLQQVFGTADSVKEIHLSNGGILKLSKTHGLLQFTLTPVTQVYSLLGIEGHNLGEKVPKFAEIYNFNVGDVFQYSAMGYNSGLGYGTESLTKTTILSKDSSQGYYSYGIKKLSCWWTFQPMGPNGDTSHSYELTTLSFQDSLLHPANYYPNQIIEYALPEVMIGPNTSYQCVSTGTAGLYSKYCGSYMFGDDPPLYHHGNLLIPPQSYELLSPIYTIFLFVNSFTTGLGNDYYHAFIFESEEENALIGYIKNGDTVRTVYPDDFILAGVKNIVSGKKPGIYPNPCTDKLYISGIPDGWDCRICIKDISGQELLSVGKGSSPIDVSSRKSGIYFLFLSDNSGNIIWKGRFLKK
ncbi:MAG: T9SS type A sorting domain-containing protein [Bacteroidota bacterium]